jgi:polyhydroxyalkanoate synthesis repressor PhaR
VSQSARPEASPDKDHPGPDAARVTIKKYANRRLYNTAKSSYVTLDHLAEMVREGIDFVVKDAKTGEDITRSVLTQIIFEEESRGQNMLPISFLRQLIGLYGDTLQGFVPGYLEAAMNTFSRNQENMRAQVRAAFEANPALANFETLARTNMEFFENAMRMFAPFSASAKGGAQQPGQPEEQSRPRTEADLQEMKRQLEAMQEKLAQLSGRD